jgi:mRNA interferase RelE/StbE
VSYKVIVRPAAEKFILRLSESDYRAIVERLRSLVDKPRPTAVKKLAGTSLWRVRVRDFRIVYSVDDKQRIIRILRVARRREDTYKGL